MKDYNHQFLLIVSAKRGILPSRKPSQKNEIKNEKYEKEITELQEEIKVLKSSNTEKTATKIYSPAKKTQT